MATLREKMKARVKQQLEAQLTQAEQDSIRNIARSNQGQIQRHEDPIELAPGVTQKDMEQLLYESKTALLEAGFQPHLVDRLLTNQSTQPIADLDLGKMYESLSPVFDSNKEATELILKIIQQNTEQGINLSGKEKDSLERLILRWGVGGVGKGAEAQKFWQRGLRAIGNKTGEMVSDKITDLSLGLALLDFASYSVKKFRLQFVPPSQRADIEQRVMPKIKIDDREFSHGTSAALYGIGREVMAMGKVGLGMMSQPLFGNLGIEGLKELKRYEETHQIPAIVSQLGENLSVQNVVESGWEAAGTDMEGVYEQLDDMGMYGDMIMADMAFADAVGEIVFDPFILFSGVPAKIPTAARAVAGRVAPGAVAKVTSKVARATYRFDDAIDAWKAAKKNLETVEKQVAREVSAAKDATGEAVLPAESVQKLVLAKQAMQREKKWVDQFKDAGPNEIIMLRAAKRHPDEIPDISTTRRYLADEFPEEGFTRRQNMDDIAKEMHEIRKRELERAYDGPIDWDNVDDLPLFQRRQLMGPDDTEAAGDALNLIARGGTPSVDDVTLLPAMPEYGGLPATPVNLINWRKAEAAGVAGKEVWAAANPPTPMNLWKSTAKMLDNQVYLTKKSLGKMREIGDKTRIKVYEAQLNTLKKHQADLAKSVGMKKVAQKYDDIWLPKDVPGVLENPNTFNRWMSAAHDRMLRSLYPGGAIINNTAMLAESKGGQLLGIFREPQRFYETYSPGAWDRFRGSMLRYDQEVRVWYDKSIDLAEKAKVIKPRAKWNPAKEFSPYSVDETRQKQAFDLLNTPKTIEDIDGAMVENPAFRKLVDQADEGMMNFHNKIRERLDHMADLQGISDTEKYLTGYIRHVFDHSQFAGGARPLEYIGLPAKAEVFASHLLSRTGAQGYKKDVMLALDYYGRAATRKRVLEPMYDDMIQTGKDLARQYGNPSFQTYSNDLVNTLMGKPTPLGKRIDDVIGMAVTKEGKRRWNPGVHDRALMGISGLFWAGALPGNPRYPIMQIGTGIATGAGRFGPMNMTRGLMEMGTREGQALNKQIGTYDTFLDIFESDFMRKFSTFISKRGYTISPLGVQSTASTEEYIRGATALASTQMYLEKMGFATMAEAKAAGFERQIAFQGLRGAEEVNHMFGAKGRSATMTRTVFRERGLAVAGTQFLSFIPKQVEELAFQWTRNPGHIATYLMMSGWMSRLAAEEAGIDITDYVGLGFLPKEPRDITSPLVDAWVKNLTLLDAMSSRDPVAVSKAQEDFLGALDTILPMFVAFSAGTRGAGRLQHAEQTTKSGQRLRPLDFEETLRLDQPPESFQEMATRIGESLRPGELKEGEAMPGIGGDFIPSMFGQMPIRDKIHRIGQRAITRERQKKYFYARKIVQQLVDGIEDNNDEMINESLEELVNLNMPVLGATALEREVAAREISWILRAIEHDPALIDRYMRIIESHGLGLEP
jgi:hypothetical protein